MNLYQKIMAIYPELQQQDFVPEGTIALRNDDDEKGDYIEKWQHPKFAKPTDEQLSALD